MLKIRLQPTGKNNYQKFRLVVQDVEEAVAGKVIDSLGYYDPKGVPCKLEFNLEAVDKWVKKGAKLSSTASALVNRARSGKWEDLKQRKKISKHKKVKQEEASKETASPEVKAVDTNAETKPPDEKKEEKQEDKTEVKKELEEPGKKANDLDVKAEKESKDKDKDKNEKANDKDVNLEKKTEENTVEN